ncbi:unnamed protein product [Rhizophagus irregularis]|uniref:HTH CENPB-type domain-containing protein n=1 Tax=Rhizophagus irregularis TaxID=588596 RepID=A0A915ZF42_9GLOM|nr:unnamed protein product [Rhizophagus irregularis]
MFDKAMQIWTSQAVAADIPLSDMMLQKKGLEFAKSLKIENEIKCANGWVYKFNGLYKVNFSGEANSASLATLSEKCKVPERKKDKNCLSVLLCANSTGSHKFPSLIIGKSLNSRCFKNINKSALPITYRANSKAWMRSDIFIEWLQHLDRWFCTINRKILLLVDNAESHFNLKILDKNDNNTDKEVDDSDSDNEEMIAESFHLA